MKFTHRRTVDEKFFKRELILIILLVLISVPAGVAFLASCITEKSTNNSVSVFYNYVQSITSVRIAESTIFDMLG